MTRPTKPGAKMFDRQSLSYMESELSRAADCIVTHPERLPTQDPLVSALRIVVLAGPESWLPEDLQEPLKMIRQVAHRVLSAGVKTLLRAGEARAVADQIVALHAEMKRRVEVLEREAGAR